ncbi:MAG: hypothetical protein ACYC27_09645 [Armatimonadota bacterium]
MIFILIAIDILLLLAFAFPVYYLRKIWNDWVNNKSEFLRPYTEPLQFGRRSWASRSFVLNTSVDEVRRHIDELPEINMDAILNDPSKASSVSPLLYVLPNKIQPTGIEVKWINANTVDIHARQYSDWPSNPEDDTPLPMKQRQRLVEHLVIHVQPESGNRTKISYELEIPSWIYVVTGAIILLLLAATWGMLDYQLGEAFQSMASGQGYNTSLIIWNTALLWVPLAWIATRITQVFRLQSISLIDNVISTFGVMMPKDR